jgi:thiamine biosynthesis lipoprotein
MLRRSLLVFALVPFLIGADYLGAKQMERSKGILGDVFEITVFSSDHNSESLSRVLDQAIEKVVALESAVDENNAVSPASRLKNTAQGESVALDEDGYFMLKEAVRISRLTDGAYDVTARGLNNLWYEARLAGTPPAQSAIESALPKGGYQYILLDETSRTVTLQKAGIEIDWASVAKGYAIDRTAAFLKRNGVRSAIIRFGDSLRLMGLSGDGAAWRLGIEHPRLIDRHVAILEVPEENAISTVGDYENFFLFKGKRYPLIPDPKTGLAGESRVASVSVLAPSALWSDAIARAFFVLGPEKGFEMLDSIKEEGIEALCFQEEQNGKFMLATSEAFQSYIREVLV